MKITAKEKVNLSFDIAANASTIRFFADIQGTVGEAKHKRTDVKRGLTPKMW